MPEALAELRNCAGTQFDPAVVDAIANLVVGLLWPPERSSTQAGIAGNIDRVGSVPER